ncbi:SMP-30/gluconolactonase/LRE family protein [Mesorhizobium sp. CGMCC 1.15528]|uniref:SMP-30/gluconolactonase/LRE family protein n=1 Tax=Mesorhizobium zhangyense TaxID=1776730 RepID=A0A7C9VDD8_9HYPH|nr:SMP-30/gluconolactonase/LRE family protein [Mesorhizobium zhangyense]NGN43107.1 SMP-30/gluconolactonase/LRE family protein [Mesorhizobium zhangyense]
MNALTHTNHIECVVQNHDQLGETPLWCERTQKLWWVDIEQPRLQSFDPATGAHRVIEMPGTYLGSQALTVSGARMVAIDLELQLFDTETGTATPFAVVEHGVDNRLNDGRVDQRGRLWIGTMDNQLHRPNGSLYRVDPNGTVKKMAGDIIVSNGIAFSPDGTTLYFTDTRRYISWAFDLDLDDGAITNRRVFADYSATGDRPDGACIDVDGCLWTAFFAGGRIVRYRPDGAIDRQIALPVTNPTCLCFGGKELKTLYVTSATKFLTPEQRAAEPLAGSLFAIEGIGQGLPENRFG